MSTKTSKDFIVERSTTRLYAPPGGKTSICLGGYEETPAPMRTQRTSQSNMSTLQFGENINQNQPAMISSARGRGNVSTLSFGDYKEEPVAVKKTPTKPTPVPLINITNANNNASEGMSMSMNMNNQAQQTARQTLSRGDSHSNIFGQCDGKSSVRVRQAPGGTSSIIFG